MNRTTANFLGILALACWSANVAVTRVIGEAHHYGLPGLSFTVAGLFLVFLDIVRRQPMPWRATGDRIYWLVGGAAYVLYMVLYVMGLSWSESRVLVLPLGLINYMWPSFMLVLMPLFFRCLVKPAALVAGVVLCLCGVGAALLWGLDLTRLAGVLSANWPAVAMMFACAGLWAVYSIVARKHGGNANGTGWFFLASGLVLLVLWKADGGALNFTGEMIGPFIIHAVVANAIAYLLWDIGIRRGDMSMLGALANFLPIASVAFGIWYLGESPTLGLAIGCVLVTAGAALCRRGIKEQ